MHSAKEDGRLRGRPLFSAGSLARIQALSHARLSNYRSFFGATDDAEALRLYRWNDYLSAVLSRVMYPVEVVLVTVSLTLANVPASKWQALWRLTASG